MTLKSVYHLFLIPVNLRKLKVGNGIRKPYFGHQAACIH